jgi:hypothetical protein
MLQQLHQLHPSTSAFAAFSSPMPGIGCNLGPGTNSESGHDSERARNLARAHALDPGPKCEPGLGGGTLLALVNSKLREIVQMLYMILSHIVGNTDQQNRTMEQLTTMKYSMDLLLSSYAAQSNIELWTCNSCGDSAYYGTEWDKTWNYKSGKFEHTCSKCYMSPPPTSTVCECRKCGDSEFYGTEWDKTWNYKSGKLEQTCSKCYAWRVPPPPGLEQPGLEHHDPKNKKNWKDERTSPPPYWSQSTNSTSPPTTCANV